MGKKIKSAHTICCITDAKLHGKFRILVQWYAFMYGRADVQTTEGAYFIDTFGFQPENN